MADNINLQKQLLAIFQNQTLEMKKLADLEKELLEKIQSRKKLNEELKGEIEEIQKLTREDISSIEKIALEQKKAQDLAEQRFDVLVRMRDILSDHIKLSKEGTDQEKEQSKLFLERTNLSEKDLELLKERVEENKKFLSQIRAERADTERIHESVQGFAGFLGIASSTNDIWIGRLRQTLRSTETIGNSLKSFGASIRTSFSPLLIADNLFKKVAESMLFHGHRLDDNISSFNKATGAGGAFNQTIDDVRFGSMEAGVGISQSSESMKSLFINMKDFTDLNPIVQEELARTTAKLDVMGISSETTAETLDVLTNALQMNAQQAIQTQTEIAQVAKVLGLAPQKLANDFLSSLPKLSQYGQQSISIFKQLAAQSKETGVEIQNLISIAQQFDTFEGAATSAGKLNAILGGGLINSIDLLNASEAERIDLLRQAVSASGRNFQEMSKFEKMAVANAAGISDISEAMRIFGASDEEFYRMQKAQDAEAMSTKALTEAAKQSVSVQEKMKMITEGLTGALLPVVEVVRKATEFFLRLNDALGKGLGPAILIITGALYGLYLISSLINTVNAAAIALGLKKTTVIIAENAAKTTNIATTTAATTTTVANTTAETANTTARSFNILGIISRTAALGAGLIVMAATTAASWAMAAATWAVSVAEEAWTAAQWLLNAALTANPIGLVVVAIGALIAGIAALIIYYDEINGWIEETTGGFLNLWDILILGLGPIGWAIVAIKNLIEHFDTVVQVFKDVIGYAEELWDMFVKLTSPITSFGNLLNLPGQGLPIPSFAKGTSDFEGGMALVGEEGPELVGLPPGSNVLSNENTNQLASTAADVARSKVELQKQLIKTVEKTNNSSTNNISGTPKGPFQATLMIDRHVLGKVMFEIFEDKMKLHIVE